MMTLSDPPYSTDVKQIRKKVCDKPGFPTTATTGLGSHESLLFYSI